MAQSCTPNCTCEEVGARGSRYEGTEQVETKQTSMPGGAAQNSHAMCLEFKGRVGNVFQNSHAMCLEFKGRVGNVFQKHFLLIFLEIL